MSKANPLAAAGSARCIASTNGSCDSPTLTQASDVPLLWASREDDARDFAAPDREVRRAHGQAEGEAWGPGAGLGARDGQESADHDGLKVGRGHQVHLHIYDLDPTVACFNEWVLLPVELGVLHCGVEVLGEEWFFHWGDTDLSGIATNLPKGHEVHVYRESLRMGESPLSEVEIREALVGAMDSWPENSYHPINRNCVTFAEELLRVLRVPEPFPAWVHGATSLGKYRALAPIANLGWSWISWWLTRPERQR